MAVVGVWVFELAEAYCDLLRAGGLIASVTEEARRCPPDALPSRPRPPAAPPPHPWICLARRGTTDALAPALASLPTA